MNYIPRIFFPMSLLFLTSPAGSEAISDEEKPEKIEVVYAVNNVINVTKENVKNIADEDCDETLEMDQVLDVLDAVADMASLLKEIRQLDRKVEHVGSALNRIGLYDEGGTVDNIIHDGETKERNSKPRKRKQPAKCPKDWTDIHHSCFMIHDKIAFNWEDA